MLCAPTCEVTLSGSRKFHHLVDFAAECAAEQRPFSEADEASEDLRWSNGPAGIRAAQVLDAAMAAAYRAGQTERAAAAVDEFMADNFDPDEFDVHAEEGLIDGAVLVAAGATHAHDGELSSLMRPADVIDIIATHFPITDRSSAEWLAERALIDVHTPFRKPTPEEEREDQEAVAAVDAWCAAPRMLEEIPASADLADVLMERIPNLTMRDAEKAAEHAMRLTVEYVGEETGEVATVVLEPTDPAADLAAQAFALEERAQAAGNLDLAAALKRTRLGMEPMLDEPEGDAILCEDSLADLCAPPGLVGEIVDWMEASSDRPNRALLLGTALTFVATLAGRKFATPSNLRTNNYVVTLAPSGHGKDHAISRIKALAAAARLDRCVGPARIMSASALRKLVEREPAVGCYVDEFGGFMSQIHDRRAGLHNAMIRYDMLEMFSTAGTFFAGAEYAGEAATKIYAPNFSISGTSTPEAFWSSLSSLSASDGLLARLIMIDVDGPKPKRVKPRLAPNVVPSGLVDNVRALADAGGNLSCVSSIAPSPMTVPLGEEAEAIDAQRIGELDANEGCASADAMPFLNRVREHALKLALVVAVGCNPDEPIITGPVLDWAYRLARLSASTLIKESADRIADNERGDAMNRILRMIRAAGDAGVTPGRIADKQRGIDARLRDQILRDLIAAGRITLDRQSGTGGRARERYIAA